MPNRRRFCCTAQHSTAQYSPDPEKARVYTVVKFLENEEQVWAPNTLGRGIPGWGLAWWSPNLMRQGGPGLRLAWEMGPGRWEIARRHSNPLRAETFFVPLSSACLRGCCETVVPARPSHRAKQRARDDGVLDGQRFSRTGIGQDRTGNNPLASVMLWECVNSLGRKTWHQTAETQRLGEDGTYVRVFYPATRASTPSQQRNKNGKCNTQTNLDQSTISLDNMEFRL